MYVVPDELKYTRTHEWAKLSDENYVVVGITDYAQKKLMDIVYVSLPEAGMEVMAGESIADIESGKVSASVYSPVSGVIKKVNYKLEDEPELINKDPYGEGWIVIIKPSLLEEEWNKLLDPEEYKKLIEVES